MITPARDAPAVAPRARTTTYPYILKGYFPASDPDAGEPETGCSVRLAGILLKFSP